MVTPIHNISHVILLRLKIFFQNAFIILLTDADSGQQSDGQLRLFTVGEEWLDNVVSKGEGNDSGGAGPHDHTLHPEAEEGEEGPEGLEDVGVVGPGAYNSRAQFCVAIGSDHGESTAQHPDNKRQPHGARLLEHAARAHKDARPDDGADDDGDTIEQGDLGLEAHLAVVAVIVDALARRAAHRPVGGRRVLFLPLGGLGVAGRHAGWLVWGGCTILLLPQGVVGCVYCQWGRGAAWLAWYYCLLPTAGVNADTAVSCNNGLLSPT